MAHMQDGDEDDDDNDESADSANPMSSLKFRMRNNK